MNDIIKKLPKEIGDYSLCISWCGDAWYITYEGCYHEIGEYICSNIDLDKALQEMYEMIQDKYKL